MAFSVIWAIASDGHLPFFAESVSQQGLQFLGEMRFVGPLSSLAGALKVETRSERYLKLERLSVLRDRR